MINELRFLGRMDIDDELEDRLLQLFGTEPRPYEYTEQDLSEQIRKIVTSYNEEKGKVIQPF
jgi:hypothetical protein